MYQAVRVPESTFDQRWADGPAGSKIHAGTVLREGQWEGDACFIVGGGPSLKGFDFSLLNGHKTIAINRAFYDVPDPSIAFGVDYRFIDWVLQGKYDKECPGIREKWKSMSALKVWLDIPNTPMDDVLYLRSPGISGISTSFTDGLYHGNNSGYSAIQLALVLGANPIYLLGFDQHFAPGGGAHYHQGHPDPVPGFAFDNMLPYFNEFSKTEASDRVINLTLGSMLHGMIQEEDFPFESEPIFVSFYTTGTSYEQEIKVLERGLIEKDIKYHFEALESRGSWLANCAMKPRFILTCMERLWPHPIVWLDADSEIVRRPDLLLDSRMWDIAYHEFKWESGRETSSAVIGLRNTRDVRSLVREWAEESEKYLMEYDYDQRVFGRILSKHRDDGLSIFDLPPQYDQIFDLMADVKDPVIKQNQASRRFRHEIDKGGAK